MPVQLDDRTWNYISQNALPSLTPENYYAWLKRIADSPHSDPYERVKAATENTLRQRFHRDIYGAGRVIGRPEIGMYAAGQRIEEEGLPRWLLGIGESLIETPGWLAGQAQAGIGGGVVERPLEFGVSALTGFAPVTRVGGGLLGLGTRAAGRGALRGIRRPGEWIRQATGDPRLASLARFNELAEIPAAGPEEWVEEAVASGIFESLGALAHARRGGVPPQQPGQQTQPGTTPRGPYPPPAAPGPGFGASQPPLTGTVIPPYIPGLPPPPPGGAGAGRQFPGGPSWRIWAGGGAPWNPQTPAFPAGGVQGQPPAGLPPPSPAGTGPFTGGQVGGLGGRVRGARGGIPPAAPVPLLPTSDFYRGFPITPEGRRRAINEFLNRRRAATGEAINMPGPIYSEAAMDEHIDRLGRPGPTADPNVPIALPPIDETPETRAAQAAEDATPSQITKKEEPSGSAGFNIVDALLEGQDRIQIPIEVPGIEHADTKVRFARAADAFMYIALTSDPKTVRRSVDILSSIPPYGITLENFESYRDDFMDELNKRLTTAYKRGRTEPRVKGILEKVHRARRQAARKAESQPPPLPEPITPTPAVTDEALATTGVDVTADQIQVNPDGTLSVAPSDPAPKPPEPQSDPAPQQPEPQPAESNELQNLKKQRDKLQKQWDSLAQRVADGDVDAFSRMSDTNDRLDELDRQIAELEGAATAPQQPAQETEPSPEPEPTGGESDLETMPFSELTALKNSLVDEILAGNTEVSDRLQEVRQVWRKRRDAEGESGTTLFSDPFFIQATIRGTAAIIRDIRGTIKRLPDFKVWLRDKWASVKRLLNRMTDFMIDIRTPIDLRVFAERLNRVWNRLWNRHIVRPIRIRRIRAIDRIIGGHPHRGVPSAGVGIDISELGSDLTGVVTQREILRHASRAGATLQQLRRASNLMSEWNDANPPADLFVVRDQLRSIHAMFVDALHGAMEVADRQLDQAYQGPLSEFETNQLQDAEQQHQQTQLVEGQQQTQQTQYRSDWWNTVADRDVHQVGQWESFANQISREEFPALFNLLGNVQNYRILYRLPEGESGFFGAGYEVFGVTHEILIDGYEAGMSILQVQEVADVIEEWATSSPVGTPMRNLFDRLVQINPFFSSSAIAGTGQTEQAIQSYEAAEQAAQDVGDTGLEPPTHHAGSDISAVLGNIDEAIEATPENEARIESESELNEWLEGLGLDPERLEEFQREQDADTDPDDEGGGGTTMASDPFTAAWMALPQMIKDTWNWLKDLFVRFYKEEDGFINIPAPSWLRGAARRGSGPSIPIGRVLRDDMLGNITPQVRDFFRNVRNWYQAGYTKLGNLGDIGKSLEKLLIETVYLGPMRLAAPDLDALRDYLDRSVVGKTGIIHKYILKQVRATGGSERDIRSQVEEAIWDFVEFSKPIADAELADIARGFKDVWRKHLRRLIPAMLAVRAAEEAKGRGVYIWATKPFAHTGTRRIPWQPMFRGYTWDDTSKDFVHDDTGVRYSVEEVIDRTDDLWMPHHYKLSTYQSMMEEVLDRVNAVTSRMHTNATPRGYKDLGGGQYRRERDGAVITGIDEVYRDLLGHLMGLYHYYEGRIKFIEKPISDYWGHLERARETEDRRYERRLDLLTLHIEESWKRHGVIKAFGQYDATLGLDHPDTHDYINDIRRWTKNESERALQTFLDKLMPDKYNKMRKYSKYAVLDDIRLATPDHTARALKDVGTIDIDRMALDSATLRELEKAKLIRRDSSGKYVMGTTQQVHNALGAYLTQRERRTEGARRTMTILSSLWEKVDASKFNEDFWRSLSSFTTVMTISPFSTVRNLMETPLVVSRTGVSPFLRGMKKFWADAESKNLANRMMNIIANAAEYYSEGSNLQSNYLRLVGYTPAERMSRSIGLLTGFEASKDWIKDYLRKPNRANTMRLTRNTVNIGVINRMSGMTEAQIDAMFKEIEQRIINGQIEVDGVRGSEYVAPSNPLTDIVGNEIMRAASFMSSQVFKEYNILSSPEFLSPDYLQGHPLQRLLFKFKSWAAQMTRYLLHEGWYALKEARHGNFKPMIQMVVAFSMMGAGAWATQVMFSALAGKELEDDWFSPWGPANALMASGVMGWISTVTEFGKYADGNAYKGAMQMLNYMAGPFGGIVSEVGGELAAFDPVGAAGVLGSRAPISREVSRLTGFMREGEQ